MDYDYTLLKPSNAYIIKGFKVFGATILLSFGFGLLGWQTLMGVIGALGGIWTFIIFASETGAQEDALTRFITKNDIQPLDSIAQNAAVPEYLRGVGNYEDVFQGFRFIKGLKWPVDVTEYQYIEGSGRSQQVNSFTVASFRTEKPYPQLFLDGKANGRTKFLYKRGQKLELEGDFNKYFTLYASPETGSTALAVITPDVMHSLVTSGRKFDVEISGNMVSVVGKDNYYTEKDLPVLLGFVDVLQKEFSQLDWSWQPVFSKTGEPLNLRRTKTRKILWTVLTVTIVLIIAILAILPSLMS